MTFGLIMSLVLHASLLGFALLSVAATPPAEPKVPTEAIVADVISESDLNRMRKGVREAKLDEAEAKVVPKPDEAKKETPRPRPVTAQPPPPAAAEPPPPKPVEVAKAESPPPPPVPEKVEPPPPAPEPAPDKAALDQKLEELALQKAEEDKTRQESERKAAEAKAKADEQKRLEEQRKAEERKKAEEKRKRDLAEAKRKADERKKAEEKRKAELAKQKQLDTSRLSALLDKAPDPKQAPAANDPPSKATTAKGPVRGDATGRDQTISANEASFLAGLMRQQVSRCWNINAGLDGIQAMVVRIDVKLNSNGEIVGEPRIVNTNASPVFQDAAASAKRALIQCAPYQLPPDKYAGGWEHMVLTFDPARMF